MTIKYEPVFGDQSLFDKLFPTANAEVIYFNPKVHPDIQYTWSGISSVDNPRRFGVYVIAMRRIIKTPTWTRADQEAGVLPPVGAEIVVHEANYIVGKIIAIDNEGQFWAQRSDGYVDCLSVADFSPLETPEEKAARVKQEWLLRAAGLCQFGKFLEGVYDALLSGELKAPTND